MENTVLCKLEDLSERITKGSTPTSYGFQYKQEGINFVKAENIDSNGNIFGIIEFIDEKTNTFLGRSILKSGDLLFSIAGTIGRVGIVKNSDLPANTNQALAIIRLVPEYLNLRFLFYYLSAHSFRKGALTKIVGVGRANLSLENLSEFNIQLPGRAEQDRIATLIEELSSDLDNAIENLKKAQEQLKIYRQAVLSAAFHGGSSKAGFSRKNWKEMSVDEIGEVITGNTPSKQESSYYGRTYPLYKPGDLDAGFMTIDSVDGLTEKGIEKARMLPAKSILVTCIGATIGKTGLIRKAGASNQQINAIVPKDFMVSEYVYYFCVSPIFQEQIKSNASATTLPILNKTKFQRLMFLVPSRDEQVAIVQEIESRFSLCEKLEETIHINLQKAESLRQSILKQAFEGKLTEQWRKEHKELISGENSAEALLKKIKAEKEALQVKPKGRKKHD